MMNSKENSIFVCHCADFEDQERFPETKESLDAKRAKRRARYARNKGLISIDKNP